RVTGPGVLAALGPLGKLLDRWIAACAGTRLVATGLRRAGPGRAVGEALVEALGQDLAAVPLRSARAPIVGRRQVSGPAADFDRLALGQIDLPPLDEAAREHVVEVVARVAEEVLVEPVAPACCGRELLEPALGRGLGPRDAGREPAAERVVPDLVDG